MIIVLTDGTEVFETRTGVDLMEWDKLNRQAQEATDGNLFWEARVRFFFCSNICLAGSEDGCAREEELPEDTEITDNPDNALCPCFTLSVEGNVEDSEACPNCKEQRMDYLLFVMYFGPYSERVNQWVGCATCGQIYEV